MELTTFALLMSTTDRSKGGSRELSKSAIAALFRSADSDSDGKLSLQVAHTLY